MARLVRDSSPGFLVFSILHYLLHPVLESVHLRSKPFCLLTLLLCSSFISQSQTRLDCPSFTLLFQGSFKQLVKTRGSPDCNVFFGYICNLAGMDHVICIMKLVDDSNCNHTVKSASGAIVWKVIIDGGMPCVSWLVEFVGQVANRVW